LLEYSALELFLASRSEFIQNILKINKFNYLAAIMFALPNTDVVKTVVSILPPCGIG